MNKAKRAEFLQKLFNHDNVAGVAVVVLSAKDLSDLLASADLAETWEKYDDARGEYDLLRQQWDDAQTVGGANSLLPRARLARDTYEKSRATLKILLGRDPDGAEPVAAEYFSKIG